VRSSIPSYCGLPPRFVRIVCTCSLTVDGYCIQNGGNSGFQSHFARASMRVGTKNGDRGVKGPTKRLPWELEIAGSNPVRCTISGVFRTTTPTAP
jgi:hypothetical protein